uniref:Cation/H+ exchanger domain-containing protein n=2 Tax=Panagrolaimus TaxID=55784 RepID=A0A914ZH98_9BILA
MAEPNLMNISHHPTHFVSTEGGIFTGKGVLNSPLSLFLVQATIIISLSRFIHIFLSRLRQPRVIAEIIGGICLGPSVLGNIPGFTEIIFPKSSLSTLSLVASFGLVLYMFLMGLELDTGILLKGVKRVSIISLAGIILPGILGSAVSYGMYEYLMEPERQKLTPFPSFLLFTFVAMAITAFPVLARILTEKKLLGTTVGLMTISAAAIDDICAWTLLALSISVINAGNPFTAAYVLFSITIFAIFLLVPVRMILRKAFEKFLGSRHKMLTQMTFAMIFVMIFLCAWTTEWIGVHAIFGAFLVGIIIPRMGGITVELTHKLEDLVGIALLPLYFASSGLKTRLALLNDWTTAFFAVLVIIVACSGKIIGCSLAAKSSGFPWRESLSIGILMNTKGLVELIVLNIGVDAGVINERIFAVMVVMALVTTFMTSPIIAYVYPPKYQIEPKAPRKRIISTNEDVADQHILLYLKDNDSIPLLANILQMFRGSLPSSGRLFLNGFKAFTDMDRSSAIMVTTQSERIIENDSTLKMFQFFGKLIGAITKSFIATTRINDIGVEVDRIAQNEGCDLMLLPWQQNDETGDQRKAVTSILDSAHHATVGIFVDNRLFGADAIVNGTPFNGITLIFANAGSLNDREAFKIACQLRSHVKIRIPLTIVHLRSGTANMESDLIKAAKILNRFL